MSFLLDPPLMFAAGEAYARAPESAQGRGAVVAAGAAAVGAAAIISTAAWLDLPVSRPLWKAMRAPSGRAYQLGAPLVPVRGPRRAGPREHALYAAGLLSYPLSFWLGWDRGRRRRP